VKIDIPWINTVVRDRINTGKNPDMEFLVDGLTPDTESSGPGLQKRLFGNFETLAKLGSAFAPLSNWMANAGPTKAVLERVAGVDRRREFPSFCRETLVEWFADRNSRVTDPERRVVLYPDLYTNHMLVERGKAAVRVLEALGCEVAVPTVPGSGRAPLSQGMIDTATTKAEGVTEALAPYVADGYDVVVIEPSDLAMFRGDYERLLPESAFEPLAENSYEIIEYAYGLLANGAEADALSTGDGEPVAYHSHCQQRTMGLEEYTLAVFEECGYEVATSDVECCGMAGSFGYKEQYYDLAMDVGSNLEGQLREMESDRVIASGTSCTDQIGDLLGEEPAHPVELLAPSP
jgi:Fe-S oxidoreductase